MIALLSPAKTLDFNTDNQCSNYTIPEFMSDSEYLIEELKKYNSTDLSRLMTISSSLSNLNIKRYNDWDKNFNLYNSKQSILCFKGGVYVGLDADSFSDKDLAYSQNYLRILSGLHGILKPLDLISPYRLEMGTKLKTKKGKNLYEFWGDKLTQSLNHSLEETNSSFIINLASQEYFSSLISNQLNAVIIDVKFLDQKNGVHKIISFFAKKARGAMASFLIKNQIKSINDLKCFQGLGYSFDPSRSSENGLVFIR